jgi:hypothetical protein
MDSIPKKSKETKMCSIQKDSLICQLYISHDKQHTIPNDDINVLVEKTDLEDANKHINDTMNKIAAMECISMEDLKKHIIMIPNKK